MPKTDRNDGLLGYNLPIEVVRAQTQRMRKEMAETGELFIAALERMETCARNVRDCSLRSDRLMFQPFFDAMFAGRRIRILGSKDETQVYEITGVDGCGFFLRREGAPQGAQEIYVSVADRPDLAKRIRRVKESATQSQMASSSSAGSIPPAPSNSSSSSSSSSEDS